MRKSDGLLLAWVHRHDKHSARLGRHRSGRAPGDRPRGRTRPRARPVVSDHGPRSQRTRTPSPRRIARRVGIAIRTASYGGSEERPPRADLHPLPSADRPLYDALRKALSGEPDCEVVIDRRESERRTAERRGSTTAAGRQRRARQRRERIPVDSEIRECGWAVVKINTWPEVDGARRAT